MDDLHEELLFNIFHRLPIESIGSCMCVNKNLNSVIKQPSFVSSYTKIKNKDKQHLMFMTRNGRKFELRNQNNSFHLYKQFDFPSDIADLQFYNPVCNGMLCLRRGLDIILWNPTIQKSLTLPRSNSANSGYSASNVAFWFDDLTNDYKVMKIFPETKNESALVEIFSLKNNQWKHLSGIDPKFLLFYDAPVFNGALNWIGRHRPGPEENGNKAILSFDVNDQVFRTIELPDVVRIDSQLLLYKESSIAVSCFIYDDSDWPNYGIFHPEVWVMKEYGNVETWTKLWHYDSLVDIICYCPKSESGIGLLNTGEVLWTVEGTLSSDMHAVGKSQMIVSTDPETGVHNRLAVFPSNYFSTSNVTYFEESLVLLLDIV